MKDKADLARAWLEKSDSDLNAASWIVDGPGPFDTACFHAQQATEKALKAALRKRSQGQGKAIAPYPGRSAPCP